MALLTTEEIKLFIDEDAASTKKHLARMGERYFDGDHDIKNLRLFYYNADGELVEDKARANVKIAHPFFKELVEQGTQYTLSGNDGFVFSDIPELQTELDARFNNNDDFIDELSGTITDCQTKGFAYMYAMKDASDKLKFTCADSIGVVEVEARFASDNKDHVLYWYVDRVDKEGHQQKKIMDWDDEQVYYYVQSDQGEIEEDTSIDVNPRPHILYKVDGDKSDQTYIDSFGFLPFFRLDNNKKQISNLKPVKDLIDDYDLMASSLSNNLVDFDHPLYAVKGFEGDNLDELQQNLKTKKIVGVGAEGGIEVHTIDVPYEARKVKMELDEKNIYRFGMGLNMSGLKDTSATTNIAIKAAYSLLDLRCKHLERNIKRFLRKIVTVCIDEINQQNGTDYQITDVYFEFTHEVMSNEQENKQNELTDANRKNVEINMLMSLVQVFGNDLVIQYICDVLDIDYEEIKDQLPDDEAAKVEEVQNDLDGLIPDDEGGDTGEQIAEGSTTGTS
ncbi:phage portal protein [uncultured Eubacterium sp.]|uniref:phage portal protein n=1 Tax=uncultured Eubacterium sp. TaxID=165185 RepID=UPI0026067A79|nr:phage portal protein [uncultured Eubacterium sp.]